MLSALEVLRRGPTAACWQLVGGWRTRRLAVDDAGSCSFQR
jgi:hypothetical protein